MISFCFRFRIDLYFNKKKAKWRINIFGVRFLDRNKFVDLAFKKSTTTNIEKTIITKTTKLIKKKKRSKQHQRGVYHQLRDRERKLKIGADLATK